MSGTWSTFLLSLACATLCACGHDASSGNDDRPRAASGARSLLVVTYDTTRMDFVGAYGNPLALTPNLDALAERGVLFEDAYAPVPQTLPSHSSLMTGLMPRQHRALENTYRLDASYETLAEAAVERGYDTAAFVGALVLGEDTGINQGFHTYDTPAGEWNSDKKGHPPQRSAKQVTEAALAWLRARDSERPVFMWVHYYDPHGDAQDKRPNAPRHIGFLPPQRHVDAIQRSDVRAFLESRGDELSGASLEPRLLRQFWHAYAAEIRFTDEQFGRLLEGFDEVGLLDSTVVAATSDHGEGLFEHDVKGHGVEVWQEQHQIPLVIAEPGGALAGTRVSGPAFLSDMRGTLERLAFGSTSTQGGDELAVDLWGAAEAGRGIAPRPVFLERPHFDQGRAEWRGVPYGVLNAVIQGDAKLIVGPEGRLELYDLASDPAELRDLAASDPELRGRLEQLFADWVAANPSVEPGEGAAELDCDQIADLVALGYMGEEALSGCP
ncbi:MAG: sulfatase [Planctomycetota bacterium]|nr:MAG: sulfatase [Planctomycetota bacterium]